MSTEDRRLYLALDCLHAGVRSLREDEAEFAASLSDALPDEAAEVERAITMLARVARSTEANAKACKEIADENASRAKRLAERAQRMRGMILSAMDVLGVPKIEAPDMTISMRPNGPQVVLTDEATIPDDFWRVTRTPDKTAIRDALKAGTRVPGAELSNGLPSIQIRGT